MWKSYAEITFYFLDRSSFFSRRILYFSMMESTFSSHNLQGILVLAYLFGVCDVSSVIATLTFGDRRRFSWNLDRAINRLVGIRSRMESSVLTKFFGENGRCSVAGAAIRSRLYLTKLRVRASRLRSFGNTGATSHVRGSRSPTSGRGLT